jgi:hypothetical protein
MTPMIPGNPIRSKMSGPTRITANETKKTHSAESGGKSTASGTALSLQ